MYLRKNYCFFHLWRTTIKGGEVGQYLRSLSKCKKISLFSCISLFFSHLFPNLRNTRKGKFRDTYCILEKTDKLTFLMIKLWYKFKDSSKVHFYRDHNSLAHLSMPKAIPITKASKIKLHNISNWPLVGMQYLKMFHVPTFVLLYFYPWWSLKLSVCRCCWGDCTLSCKSEMNLGCGSVEKYRTN